MGPNSKANVGSIQRITREKGFGFIRAEDGRDYFFHYTELQNIELGQLIEGDQVEFVGVETPKGLRANEVRLTGSPAR